MPQVDSTVRPNGDWSIAISNNLAEPRIGLGAPDNLSLILVEQV